jgi:hypothetical protein
MVCNSGKACSADSSTSFHIGVMIGGTAGFNQRKSSKFTWYAAETSVVQSGFENIERVNKSEEFYWFKCNRNGEELIISVSIGTGEIVNIENRKNAKP